MQPFCVYNNIGDSMEELPQKAKGLMGIYNALVKFLKSVANFLGISREEFAVFFSILIIAAVVGVCIYIFLFFRHYRYTLQKGVIKIQKGALFKRRHLVYLDKVSMITVKENFVQRLFSFCTVYFYVQGSVVKLPFVRKNKSAELKEILDSCD